MPDFTNNLLSQPAVRVGICAYLDIVDDPLRYALARAQIRAPQASILDTPDADFDNWTFDILDPRMISLSPIGDSLDRSEKVVFTLSSTLQFDSDIMTALSDPARFRGRIVKIWLVRFGDNWQPTHARRVKTCYMSTVHFSMGASQQVIQLSAESWEAFISSGAPSRSLLSQQLYDPGDLSAEATIGASNSHDALGLPASGRPQIPGFPYGIPYGPF